MIVTDELSFSKGAVPVSDGAHSHWLPAGPTGYVLTTDPTQPQGVKWAPGSGSGTVQSITFEAPLTGGDITGTGSVGLATTGLTITQHAGAITVDTPSGGAVTCTFSASDTHSVTMVANTTFTFAAPTVGQKILLILIQGGSGSYVPTLPGTVDWGAAGAPTWSTAENAIDLVTLFWDGTKYRAGVYWQGS